MDKGKEMLGAALSTRRWSYLTISSDQGDLKISGTSRKWTGKEKRLFSGVSRFNITLHDLEHSNPRMFQDFFPLSKLTSSEHPVKTSCHDLYSQKNNDVKSISKLPDKTARAIDSVILP